MSTLSVLYVVCGEEKTIEQSLKSIVPIADEIVIVNTCSSDRTLQICRRFHKTKIITHNWVHDFSKTKNHGLGLCTMDWILCIDGDEMLDEKSASVIKSAVCRAAPNVSGFDVHIVDHEDEWGTNAKSNEKSFFESPQVRVVRKDPRIRFEGSVQETARRTASKVGAIDVLDARIHHYLWKGRGPEYARMRKRYYNKLGAKFDIAETDQQEAPPEEDRSPPSPKVAIVLAAYNAIAATKACIESVNRCTSENYEFYLVDNGSTDGTTEFLRSATGKNTLRTARNTGVAKGRNKGAIEAFKDPNVKYFCFLDNDTVVTTNWLTQMLSVLEEHREIGIVGPFTSSANGQQKMDERRDPEIVAKELAKAEHSFIKVKEIDRFCMLIRADVLGSIGLFDDSFGTYGYEDYDLCRRVSAAGYDVAIASRAYVQHQGGATILANKLNWSRLMLAAEERFREKWKEETPGTVGVPSSIGTKSGLLLKSSGGFTHPKTSIVVLTCNRKDMTCKCIGSILDSTTNYELIVVDNGSTDGTVEWLSGIRGIRLVRNERNEGIPKGRNQGIRASRYENIVLMDNDVIVRQGWLDELFWELKNGKDIVGIEAWKLGPDHAPVYQCNCQTQQFDYLGGACCLFKRKVFEEAGLLDEGFSPAYFEDCDIAVRAKRCGFKLGWKPSPKIQHKEHATLIYGQKDFNYQEQLSRSYVRFAQIMKGEIKVEHEKLPQLDKKLNILYLGMYYDYGVKERGLSFEQDNFYAAFEKWARTGKLTQFDFVALGQQHGIPKMSQMLLQKVEEIMPDALFAIFFNPESDPRREVLKRISEQMPTTTIGWFCDSHWRYPNFDRPWADCLNYCVTTSSSAYQRYIGDGLGGKAIKSQWAASPKYVKIPDLKRDVEVSFVGQPHGDRRKIIGRLQEAGIRIEFYGSGWAQRLSFDDMVRMFNRTKVNLNLSNSCNSTCKQIKGRNFEVPACGGFLLSEKAENLNEYYEYGKEIGVYENVDELIAKVRYYLMDDEEREKVATAAYERTIREHTYANRFDHIFARAGLL